MFARPRRPTIRPLAGGPCSTTYSGTGFSSYDACNNVGHNSNCTIGCTVGYTGDDVTRTCTAGAFDSEVGPSCAGVHVQ